MSDRRKLIEKVRALLQKTAENGCTEGEAMAAAAKAAELMAQFDLTMTDVEIGATECTERPMAAPARDHPIQWVLTAVAHFTDTRVWLSKQPHFAQAPQTDLFGHASRGRTEWLAEYVFFGFEPDVEVAHYLVDICKTAMDRGAADFRASFGARPKDAWTSDFQFGQSGHGKWNPDRECARQLSSFLTGMAVSMAKTLRTLKDEQRRKTSGSGRDLVVVKGAVVEREMEARGIRLDSGRSRAFADGAGYEAGRDAGRRVSFNAGVRGGRPLALSHK